MTSRLYSLLMAGRATFTAEDMMGIRKDARVVTTRMTYRLLWTLPCVAVLISVPAFPFIVGTLAPLVQDHCPPP
jgi:hypothetical protein